MREIEKRWVKLQEGYQKLKVLSARLDAEWKRSIQVASRRKYKKEYSIWQSNRRVFLLVVFGFLLLCFLLCGLAAFSKKLELQCLYSFLAFSFLTGGVGFVFLARKSIRSILTRPVLETYSSPSQRLTNLWWNSLQPRTRIIQNSGDEGVCDFIKLLMNLPDSYLVVSEILTSKRKITDTDVLLLGPSGIWVFELKHWYGEVYKKDGVWWQDVSGRRIDHLQESGERKQGPDEQWINQVHEIKTTLQRRRPAIAWTTKYIQGGIVFSNPQVKLEPKNIRENRASYGRPKNWLDRILNAQAVKGFNLDVRLQVLDALIEFGLTIERDQISPVSASKLADRAYQKASQEWTQYVTQWVK